MACICSRDTEVYLDQERVQMVIQIKEALRVIIDDTLSWDGQVEIVCLNIARRITSLKLLPKFIDKTCTIHIFYQ